MVEFKMGLVFGQIQLINPIKRELNPIETDALADSGDCQHITLL
ncbi:MAG: hypothetical protein AB4058_04205 [Microcystaceae cyanobacterium]